MLPLFELFMKAENGKAMDALARQFNLAQGQTAQAVAALLPAFSAAFKRQSGTPFDFMSLMQRAASGDYARYFEDLTRAFTPQGVTDGNAALGALFGSDEIARAVADQAARLTGLSQDVLKQMMPALADTMMGGLFKEMTGQLNGAATANPFTPDGMLQMQRQWLEGLGLAPRKPDPLQAQMAAMFDNPFTKAMQGLFTGQPAQAKETDPFGFNPAMKAFQDMMASATRAATPQPAKEEPAPAGAAEASAPDAYGAFINQMFDSGLEVQKSYQQSLDAILGSWTKKDGA